MEPLLRHGDEILVDRGSRFERDGVHVVRLGEALMVKRLASAGAGRIALLSQNLAYPPVEVSLDEVEAWCGRAGGCDDRSAAQGDAQGMSYRGSNPTCDCTPSARPR